VLRDDPSRPHSEPFAPHTVARTRSPAAHPGSGAGPAPAQPQPAVDLKPVSETPTEPADYAAISLTFGSLLGALAVASRGRDPIERAELVPLAAATFSLSRLLVHDKVETWLREPFVDESPSGKQPKGQRLRFAVGELLTCTRCMGAWSALALVGLRMGSPGAARTVTSVLAASAGNDALQAGFALLTARANTQEAAADVSSHVASTAKRAA